MRTILDEQSSTIRRDNPTTASFQANSLDAPVNIINALSSIDNRPFDSMILEGEKSSFQGVAMGDSQPITNIIISIS